jgi:hypothetical protein
MAKTIFIAFLILFACSCKTNRDADRRYMDSKADKVYNLRLDPAPGSSCKYDIRHETDMKLEIDDRKVNNINRTSAVVNYGISKDSSGDFVFKISYDKIHLYAKNGDSETDADAANASTSINATEKMLGILKNATITASVSKGGKIKSVNGYKELGAKLIGGLAANDTYSRNIAQAKWDQVIGEGLVKKNMNELFAFFPDSAVHVGDQWKMSSRQKSDIPLNVVTTYRLKEINNGIADLSAEAVLTSDSSPINYMGTEVTASLDGNQEADYQVDLKTGMLKNCESNAKVSGTLQMVGREIPVTIKTQLVMKIVEK